MELNLVTPPYEHVTKVELESIPENVRGGIVVIDVATAAGAGVDTLGSLVTRLQGNRNITLALRVRDAVGAHALRLAMVAHPLGIRAVIADDEPLRPALWGYLANPFDLPGDLVTWLTSRVSVSPYLSSTIEQIVRTAPLVSDFVTTLDHIGVLPRTLRQQFRRESLPGPSAWYHLGRLLDAQRRLLHDRELRVTDLALELGYADRMSFTNRVYRLFGVTAEKARQLLGWEWRFFAWWDRVSRTLYP